MGMLCSLSDGEKQIGTERINLDVKYLRGERDAKTLTAGKFTPANSLLILVDGENSGEVSGLQLRAIKAVLSSDCL